MPPLRVSFVLCVLATVLLFGGTRPPLDAIAPSTTQGDALPRLQLGVPLHQRTRISQSQRYALDLDANDFIDIRVQQDTVTAEMKLYDPAGAEVHASALQVIDPLPARFLHVVQASGLYQLDVRMIGVPSQDGQENQFEIELITRRPATAVDVERAQIAAVGDRASMLLDRHTDMAQVIALLQEAAAGWRRIGDPLFEAMTLKSLGSVTSLFTQYRVASAEAFRRLTSLFATLGLVDEEANAWLRLGSESLDDGQLAAARDAVLQAVRLIGDRPRPALLGPSLRIAALAESRLGNYVPAQEYATQAIEVAATSGDRVTEGRALEVLASLQSLSGDMAAAIQLQERAVDALTDRPPLGRLREALTVLGFYQLRHGNLDAADQRFTASLALAPRAPFADMDALTYLGLGDVAVARGDRGRARMLYVDARSRLIKLGNPELRCRADVQLAQLLFSEGEHEAARQLFDTALTLGRDMASPTCEAGSRLGLVEIARAGGALDDAHAHVQRVVQLYDAFREASTSAESRAIGFAGLVPIYERAIDVTMQLATGDHRDARVAEALILNERSLARSLLDVLTSDRLERSVRIPTALATERRQVRDAWHARVLQHTRALQRNERGRAAALADELGTLATEMRDIERRIDIASPRQAGFTRRPTLRLEDIRDLLDEDTVLVEYGLGDARSYVWVVDRDHVRAVALAPRAEIEAAVRRTHETVASIPAAATANGTNERRALDAVAQLLVEPIAPLLTKRRVAIVAPGPLALVPFGTLPAPTDGAPVAGAARQPLLTRHEIVLLPSIAVLATARASDAIRRRAPRAVAVFADPVYEPDDPRVRGVRPVATDRGSSSGEAPVVVPRGWERGRAGFSLGRLPFSGREAAAIRRYAPAPFLDVVGLEATRERVLATDLSRYRIVHFAAHGLLQPAVPNLSGIALSLVDGRGRARNGFLMLPDVYDLTLNADLVVLSACETALGNEVRGEGVIGLPRGFMYAGAARVISSLWRVDDEATAALMDGFYRRVLRENMPAAAALRAAQLDIRRIPRWRAPFFWAGFTLQGDWR